ncbi:TonB-dependent receptor [Flavobacterium silvaticum]|uniref:TonB-dependent receptor n=1 Tax=Flavobacterium silvaticum TaxID=1852020 RepID=A0A972FP24_9FLAO|nr:TonB-dependent receptor [Flavobacterium silvaticum]NMH29619.1 TonB-dependent receptor [Flavobacterium silvaticum]
MNKLLLFVPMLITSALFAQTDTLSKQQLREVVISGFHISDSLMKAPAAIGTISKADLQANNQTEIATAMNRIAGVQMQSGSFNTNRITIRGIGARTPYGTNKIRGFYGNIPLTSGDSETTIEDIDVENISGVEVIKGPLSSVYGAGLGGAILIRPMLQAAPGNSVRLSTTGGSFGTYKNSMAYGFDSEKASVNISYHRLESDGWRENSSYKREGVTLAGELFRRQNAKLTYFGNFTKMKSYIPSSVDKNTLDNNPKAAAATWKAAKGYEAYDSYLAGLAYDFKIGNVSNSTSAFFNHKQSDEPRPFDILLQNTNGYGAHTQFSGSLFNQPKIRFLAGAEFFKDGFGSRNLENLYQQNNGNGSLRGDKIAEASQQRQIVNVFAQLRYQPMKKLEIQAGLNLNKTKFELENLFPSEERSDQSYEYDAIWSPNISVLFTPTDFSTLYASVSRGFSMPAIEETLNADGTINPDIKPESGYNVEVGSRIQAFGRKLFVEIALYQMNIKNLLVAQRVGDDQYVGVNAGESIHKGIEWSVEYVWRLTSRSSLHPFVNGNFGEYRFKEFFDRGNDRSGNRLPGVPSFKTNAGLRWDLRRFYVSGEFQYVDKMLLDDANSAYNRSFQTINAKAGYNWALNEKASIQLYAGANNITDKNYAGMILPNATTPPTGSPRSFYPANPISFYGGFTFNGLF